MTNKLILEGDLNLRKYILNLILILLVSLNLYSAENKKRLEQTLTLTLPPALQVNTLYGPDSPSFVERLKGIYFYGLGGEFSISSDTFLIKVEGCFERRREKEIQDSTWKVNFEVNKTILKPFIVGIKMDVFNESVSPFLYIPRSMSLTSYIPVSCNYWDGKILLKAGLLLGNYRNSYLAINYSIGRFRRKTYLDYGFVSMCYTAFPGSYFLNGPSVSCRVKEFLHLISLYGDFEYYTGKNKKDTIIRISGGLGIKITKSLELISRLSRDFNVARVNDNVEWGLKIHF